MKGIVLAGGTGSRLFPLTKVTNKHLLPIGQKPMIYYPIEKMIAAGVRDILIVTGLEHMGSVVNSLGSGVSFNCKFTYKVQDEAGGIAQALSLAEGFANGEPMLVILGDNIFTADLSEAVQRFKEGACIFIKEVDDPTRFGVPTLQGDRITAITEKPKNPASSFAVTGVYIYDAAVFDCIHHLSPSLRGEYEITDVNNWYIQTNQLKYEVLPGDWTDAGCFDSYFYANQLMTDHAESS